MARERMKRLIVTGSLVVLTLGPTAALAWSPRIYGAGTDSCGAFLEARMRGGAAGAAQQIRYGEWLNGFLTGTEGTLSVFQPERVPTRVDVRGRWPGSRITAAPTPWPR